MGRTAAAIGGALLVLLLGLAASLAVRKMGEPSGAILRPFDTPTLATGARLYAQHCAACHGASGEGQPNWREPGPDGLLPAPPHDASGHTWHHPDRQLFDITKFGMARVIGQPDHPSAMPAYEGVLDDGQIVAVLSWIKSQWPRDIRKLHDQLNRDSQP